MLTVRRLAAEDRAFWERRGFVYVGTIESLPGCGPGNPAASYVAALRATR